MPDRARPPKYNAEVYATITLNDLLVYSTYFLHKQASQIAPEDIISACFMLFPTKFSLKKYPQWPDSGMVSRRRGDCKRRGYLRGNALNGFQITAKGIRRAEKVGKLLGPALKPKPALQKPTIPAQTIHSELKARARKYVRSIEASDAYRHFMKRKPINEFDVRSLLLCTLETPPAVLARNMEQFKLYVQIQERKDLAAFLEFCEGKFSTLFGTGSKPIEKKSSQSGR
jgi:hypothetical protein